MELVRRVASWPAPALVLKLVLWVNVAVMALTVAAERILHQRIGVGFGEHGPVNWFSSLQLLAIATLAWTVVYLRVTELRRESWRAPVGLWVLVGLGFVGFAIDEVFEVHETIDLAIHRMLAITQTAWTDRLDDALVGAYLLAGLGIGCFYRREFAGKPLASLCRAGIGFAVISITLDFLTNGATLLPRPLNRWMGGFVEEGFKLLTEVMFIGVAYIFVTRALEPAVPAGSPQEAQSQERAKAVAGN